MLGTFAGFHRCPETLIFWPQFSISTLVLVYSEDCVYYFYIAISNEVRRHSQLRCRSVLETSNDYTPLGM
jgi:hypothetical protein